MRHQEFDFLRSCCCSLCYGKAIRRIRAVSNQDSIEVTFFMCLRESTEIINVYSAADYRDRYLSVTGSHADHPDYIEGHLKFSTYVLMLS